MQIYGIIGDPLGHSRSPEYFNAEFRREGIEAEYLSFEMKDLRELPALLGRWPELRGFNVTIPHKQNIIPFLDEISEEADAVGAVNCVRVSPDAHGPHLTGYNTDVYGFRKALQHFIPAGVTKALILGNGGAARAVRYTLRQLEMEILTVSRNPQQKDEITYAEAGLLVDEYPLIVNTTPLGTWPNTEAYPDIPYEKLTPRHYLFDLVYNPELTTFMQQGLTAGAHVCNGYEMWLHQAEKNRKIWEVGSGK